MLSEYPVTRNDEAATHKVVAALERYFGADRPHEIEPATASEDFGLFGAAWDVPVVFWVIGGIDPAKYAAAEQAGTLDTLPANHAPEFWTAASYVTRLGQANEVGLLVAGLGIEHFFDLMMDEKERQAGLSGGTRRTIEGPLYIMDAPLSKGEARLDQDPEHGTVLFIQGVVKDISGAQIPGAIVDVWHADTKGGYSHFDPSQSAFNLRRRIETDTEGRDRFRSILPVGYGCPQGTGDRAGGAAGAGLGHRGYGAAARPAGHAAAPGR